MCLGEFFQVDADEVPEIQRQQREQKAWHAIVANY